MKKAIFCLNLKGRAQSCLTKSVASQTRSITRSIPMARSLIAWKLGNHKARELGWIV
jgi:hypothetical protein